VSDVTSNSGDFSAYVSQGEGYVASPSLDTADCERVAVEFWLRKGDDAFSEDPDGNDELVVQFRESGGGWQTFNRTDPTDFADGRIFEVDDRITATDAMHSDFRIRWYLVDAEGTGLDFWHFDDVVLNGDP
jgi:MSHA biogenesis protein MshQ